MEHHRKHMRDTLQTMQEADLYANLDKCIFSAPEILVLGCFVGKEGVRADPNKIQAIVDWPPPKSVTELRQWLGVANYLHRFSKNFTNITIPITNLLKKDFEYEWTPECDVAFNQIKDSLMKAPVLVLPDFGRPFSVVCDASNFAIGAALLQSDEQGHDRAISYQSRRLQGPEKLYPRP